MNLRFNRHNRVALLALCALASCTKNFQDININPNATTTPSASLLFTKAEYDGAAVRLPLLLGTMQYTTSFNDVAGFGSKYIQSGVTSTAAAFYPTYTGPVNELVEVNKIVGEDPASVNLYAAARIWRVYCFSRLTDLYGDVPYSQAAQGYTTANYTPAYDAQKDIYADLLKELDAAAQSLDASKSTFGAADLLYGGNTAQWKKFAYSLMLRLGMRLTRVDIASAQSWVTKAIAGGVILQDGDMAKMPYLAGGQDINKNPVALNLWNNDYIAQNGNTNQEGGKYQQVFIDYLRQTRDPRLPVFSVVWTGGNPDTTSALQQGMPANLSSKPANFATLSEPNPKTVLGLGSPLLLFTVAESNFLLAEAALRGWYTDMPAATLYQNGVTAALRQWSVIAGADGTISPDKINAYVNANPLTTASFDAQMNQIYTQFWVSVFPDAHEAYSSYRRTGYPALVPNNYPGNATGGKIFRRCLYPSNELSLNVAQYQAAVTRQGPDDLMTPVWWHKQ